MGLKPIGSEKLTGQDKINRIMEIATYGETKKNDSYHTTTLSFSKKASDGNTYAIIQEKDGYYIKRGINESELDYVDGLQNKKRNRFRSYSSALKRMNLIFKPINEEFNDGLADPIFEQSSEENKFVLKTPEAEVDVTTDEMGDDEELAMDDEELDMDDEELDMDDEELEMDDEEGEEEEMEGFMKPIQKLTGKLGQKLRDAEEELGSADIKYVINSVLSAVDLDSLDGEDRDDILARFEEDETAYGDEELGDEELDMDDDELAMDDMEDMEGLEDEGEGEEFDVEEMMPESRRRRKNIMSEQILMGPLLPLLPFVKPELAKLLKKAKDEKAIQKFTAAQIKMIEAASLVFPGGVLLKALKQILKTYKVYSIDKRVYDDPKGVKEGVAMKSLKNRVSQLLESYVVQKTPQEYIKEKVGKNKINETIKNLSRTIEQELSVKKYLNENKYSKLKGLTKKGNIAILSDNKNIFITREGSIR
tara:strand:+ start:7421 stop:8854 length:1434 start_codon:yes stop_codon:yes gene_type:complete